MSFPLLLTLLLLAVAGTSAAEEDPDYRKVIDLGLTFYHGQMSGRLPSWNRLLRAQPGGWKKNSHMADGSSIGKALSGGFYDAGDYLKCSHPLAWALTNLAWSCSEFKLSYQATPGQWDGTLRVLKWGTDWLMKAHIKASNSPAGNAFVGQVADSTSHTFFGRPEHDPTPRIVYTANASTGGADLAAEYAAAFASAAVLFRDHGNNTEYAALLFRHARQAFGFAKAYPRNWQAPPEVFYRTYLPEGYLAHTSWAAAWMCKYSKQYCKDAVDHFNSAMAVDSLQYGLGYDWEAVMPGAAALWLSMNTAPAAAKARTLLEDYLLSTWQDTSSLCPKPSYSNVCYTPKGLAYYSDWGTLYSTASMVFLASIVAKHQPSTSVGNLNATQQQVCWGRSQMQYILGTSTGRSFLIGYGPNQPTQPHHRQSACAARYTNPCAVVDHGTCCKGESGVGPGGCCNAENFFSDTAAQITLSGALVGGPDNTDTYPDVRSDYTRTEPSLTSTAGIIAAAAGLQYFAEAGYDFETCKGTGPDSNCTTVEAWSGCGGAGDTCPPGVACSDAPWPGYCCAAGLACVRENQWWWMCTPAAAAATAAGQIVGGAASSLTAAAAAGQAHGQRDGQSLKGKVSLLQDVLQLTAPATAVQGSTIELAAALTRAGRPVAGARVNFTVTNGQAAATAMDSCVQHTPAGSMFDSRPVTGRPKATIAEDNHPHIAAGAVTITPEPTAGNLEGGSSEQPPAASAGVSTSMAAASTAVVTTAVSSDNTLEKLAAHTSVTDQDGIARMVISLSSAAACNPVLVLSAVTEDGRAQGARGNVIVSAKGLIIALQQA